MSTSERVASPCRNICAVDPDGEGYCAGCYRTMDEIATWCMMDDDQRRAVLVELERRRAEAEDEGP